MLKNTMSLIVHGQQMYVIDLTLIRLIFKFSFVNNLFLVVQ